jgi:hypothetical protein
MSEAEKEKTFFEHCNKIFLQSPSIHTSTFWPPKKPHPWSDCRGILQWNPLLSYKVQLKCPTCKNGVLFFDQIWASSSKSRYCPRHLFHPNGQVALISALYHCPNSCSDCIAHDNRVLEQLSSEIEPGFLLFHKSGMTREMYDMLTSFAIEGMFFDTSQIIQGVHKVPLPISIGQNSSELRGTPILSSKIHWAPTLS